MRADAISAKGKEKLKGQDIIPALSYQCSNFLKGFKYFLGSDYKKRILNVKVTPW